MKMICEFKCNKCGLIWDEWVDTRRSHFRIAPLCIKCDSSDTKKLLGGVKNRAKAKDPYDYLDKGPPDSKRIFSGPKVHSK